MMMKSLGWKSISLGGVFSWGFVLRIDLVDWVGARLYVFVFPEGRDMSNRIKRGGKVINLISIFLPGWIMAQHPVYQLIMTSERRGMAQYLMTCCVFQVALVVIFRLGGLLVGNDIRNVVRGGYQVENTLATDLRKDNQSCINEKNVHLSRTNQPHPDILDTNCIQVLSQSRTRRTFYYTWPRGLGVTLDPCCCVHDIWEVEE